MHQRQGAVSTGILYYCILVFSANKLDSIYVTSPLGKSSCILHMLLYKHIACTFM